MTARAHTLPNTGNDTLALQAAEILKRNILSGELIPGSKLRLHNLAEQYGFGITPMREAMAKLASYGLVNAIGQKGFQVATVSLEDFEDIQQTRHLVEIEALRLAIEKGDVAWEANIVAALHELKSYPATHKTSFLEGDPAFDATHKKFHAALIAACGSPRLISLHNDLSDQTYRYRVIVRRHAARTQEASNRDHESLAKLVLARNVAKASTALHKHIDSSIESLRALPAEVLRKVFNPQPRARKSTTRLQ